MSGLVISRDITIPLAEIELTAVRAQGPGGQNVNKVSSAVQLRFDINASDSLPVSVKERLLAMQDQRISDDGVVVIKAQRYRNQSMNRKSALERLRGLIRSAMKVPKRRIKTRPTNASVKRRLEDKKRHGRLKRDRRPISLD